MARRWSGFLPLGSSRRYTLIELPRDGDGNAHGCNLAGDFRARFQRRRQRTSRLWQSKLEDFTGFQPTSVRHDNPVSSGPSTRPLSLSYLSFLSLHVLAIYVSHDSCTFLEAFN